MDYDNFASGYNELYEEEQLKKLSIIKKYLKINKNTKLLDVGCGTGISANFFKCKTVGVDKSKNMLKQGRGNLIQAKAENLPFRDKSFDVVISITAIHNFRYPEKVLDEINRVKKNNYQIAITLLKKSNNYNKIKKLIYKKIKINKELDEEKDTIFVAHS